MNKHDHTSLFGSVITVLASLNLSDWGVLLGILFGLATLLMNWYYKAKELKLKEQYLHKNIKELNNEQKH